MAPAEYRPARRRRRMKTWTPPARGRSRAEAVHAPSSPSSTTAWISIIRIWRRTSGPTRGAAPGIAHGRDFVDDTDRWNPRPKVFNPPFDDTESNDIHGTPCAGVAAAAGNNRQGVAGIAWGCKLLAVKILAGTDARSLRSHCRFDPVCRAARRRPLVQLGRRAPSRRRERHSRTRPAAAAAAGARRCSWRRATSSRTGSAFPSSDERAFAVGASNDRGRRAGYSNYGHGIAFVAPSDDARRQGITTTDVHLRTKGYAPGSAYCDDFGGTSSATPLAAGHRGADALGEPVAALERGGRSDEIHGGPDRRGRRGTTGRTTASGTATAASTPPPRSPPPHRYRRQIQEKTIAEFSDLLPLRFLCLDLLSPRHRHADRDELLLRRLAGLHRDLDQVIAGAQRRQAQIGRQRRRAAGLARR